MSEIKKYGAVIKQASDADMTKINVQSVRELTADEVFIFRVAACDDQPDRDHERFTLAALKKLAALYMGKTIIMDHQWSAKNQTARIYDAEVEQTNGINRLVVYAYMLRNEKTALTIDAIEGGILREVSVGCAVSVARCSICGVDKTKTWCDHRPGLEYDGKTCIVELDAPTDAYELSFCAVPAQPGAGVIKAYGGEDAKPKPNTKDDPEVVKALALLELEEKSLN